MALMTALDSEGTVSCSNTAESVRASRMLQSLSGTRVPRKTSRRKVDRALFSCQVHGEVSMCLQLRKG
jgi:hypothetical protein